MNRIDKMMKVDMARVSRRKSKRSCHCPKSEACGAHSTRYAEKRPGSIAEPRWLANLGLRDASSAGNFNEMPLQYASICFNDGTLMHSDIFC